jgi:hypothetical protein
MRTYAYGVSLLPRRSSGSQPPPSYAAPQQQAPPKKLTTAQRKQQAAAQAAGGSAAYPGVRTDGLAGLGLDEEAAAIQTETREQDKYLDEISKGLDQLKMGAQVGGPSSSCIGPLHCTGQCLGRGGHACSWAVVLLLLLLCAVCVQEVTLLEGVV